MKSLKLKPLKMKSSKQMNDGVDELTGFLFEYVLKILIGTLILLGVVYIAGMVII